MCNIMATLIVVYHKATNTLTLQSINELFMKMIKSGRVSLSHGFNMLKCFYQEQLQNTCYNLYLLKSNRSER